LIHTLMRNWWLLALCGTLQLIYSAINLFMQNSDGTFALRNHAVKSTFLYLGELALAAGACTMAAGIWRSAKGKSWLLALNGLTLGTLGLILTFWTGPLAFRTTALLFVVIATSLGIFELGIARDLRCQRQVADGWFLRLAGAASIGFAFAFFAFALRWIELEPRPLQDFLWFGSYFGFSAICMLGLALRLHWLGLAQTGRKA
jgi:uncharacterized membrane protein HdeD (DUF308 family)